MEEEDDEIISGLSADTNSQSSWLFFFFFLVLLQLQLCTRHGCRPVMIHPDSQKTKGWPCLSGHIPVHFVESVIQDKRKLQFKRRNIWITDLLPDSSNIKKSIFPVIKAHIKGLIFRQELRMFYESFIKC